MSKDKVEKDAKPKGKGMIVMAGMAVAMLAIGGGGAFALVKFGVIGGHEAKKEDNSPKLVHKGDEDPFAPKAEGGKEGEAGKEVEGEGGSPYKTTYFTFPDDFTSNLRNSSALIQVSLACSTHRDGRVLMWLKKHELAIRSAMLAVLADTPEEDVNTIEGKDRLQKRLTQAINKVLIDTEGFGGVDAVYFKAFLVQ
ncbi:MAG: flagellar basal body-associated FliL family protein [Sphingomonadales bacterium]|nr:flagellar basal body-associated FliL family protein [Sphingomonadales bacterium]